MSTRPPAMSPPRTNATSPSPPGLTTPYVIGVCSSVSLSRGTSSHFVRSPAISQAPQVGFDGLLQLRRLGELPAQSSNEPCHLFLERLGVVLDILRADVTTGRED